MVKFFVFTIFSIGGFIRRSAQVVCGFYFVLRFTRFALRNYRAYDFAPRAFLSACVFPPEAEIHGFAALVLLELEGQRRVRVERRTREAADVGRRRLEDRPHDFRAVLFGDVNPSGKLPFTFPVRLQDNGAHAAGEYPGDGKNVVYHDDIFVGYRWFDREKIKPLFAFGHGLSYTTFQYGEVSANRNKITASGDMTLTLSVKNTGTRDGAEVVQLYLSDKKASLPRPVKELKGFKKVFLKAGEAQTVSFTIDHAMLSFYDDAKGAWISEPG